MIKKAIRILALFIIGLLLLLGGVAMLIQLPSVQTKLTQKIAGYLSEELKTKVEVGSVRIEFFSSLVLGELYVEDLHQDTLLYAEEIAADIDLFNFFESTIVLDEIRLSKAHFKLQQYEGEEHDNLQFLIDAFSGDTTSAPSPWSFGIRSIHLADCRFTYDNDHQPATDKGVDFNHLKLKGINLKADEIDFEEDTILFYLQQLQFDDHSGFSLNQLSGKARISPTEISLQQMKLKTPHTQITTDLSFLTDSYDDYSDFTEKVKMLSNFNDSRIHSGDIAFFATDLMDMEPQYVVLNGLVKGKVSNLKGKDLVLDLNGHSRFDGNVDLKGLPDIEETFIYLSINSLSTTAYGLEKIPVPPFERKKHLNLPRELKKLGKIHFKGKFTGFMTDFVAYGDFSTDMGSFSTDMSLKGQGNNTRYAGFVKANQFRAGDFFENDSLMGAVSFQLNVNGKGLTREDLSAKVNGTVQSIELYNYTYKDIRLKGEIADQLFNGDLVIKDKNLDMDFIGSVNLSREMPELNFLSNINFMNIGKLVHSKNIDTSAVVSSTLNIDIVGNSIDNLNGRFELFNTKYKDKEHFHTIRELSLLAGTDGKRKSLDLESDILDAQIVGNYQLEDLAKSYGVFIEKFIPAIVGQKYDTMRIDEDFNFNVKLKNTDILSTLFFPKIFIDSGTYVTGYYNSLGNQLTLDIQLPGATINNITVYPGFINFQTRENSLYLNSQIEKVMFSEKMYVDNLTIISETQTNESVFDISWNNTTHDNEGSIDITARYLGLQNFEFLVHESYIKVSDTTWNIPDNSSLRIDSNAFSFNNIVLESSLERIALNGKVSQNPEDELNIEVNNFDLHNFNLLIPEKTVKLNGQISGQANLKDPYNNLIFSSNIEFKDFKLNNNLMGNGSIKSFWLHELNVLNIDGKLVRGPLPTIQLQGNYFPKKKEDNISMQLQLQNTYLQLFQPYTDGILSNLRGLVSGNIKIRGSIDKPIISGNLQLQKAGFTVDYLNTSYSFSDNIIIQPDWFGFDNITIFDMKHGKAKATGTIFHNNFSNFNMDIYLLAEKFHCLNTTEKDNELYYGQAFVTGEIDVSGHTNNLSIEVDVETDRSEAQPRGGFEYTQFNIPLNTPEVASESSFIRFIKNKDKEQQSLELKPADLSGIQMSFKLAVTQEAEVRLIFDEKVGDILKARGNGNLELEINTKGDFSMFGDYIIDRGDYLFTLQNVINKRFSLENGGKIAWNGDPYSGEVDLSAIYRTRARLSDILITADSSSNYTKRIPVELVLNMENTILSPDITFDIRLPTADENTKSLLHNVLYVGTDETNENLMNKQAFSLLILNRFTPPDQGLSGTGFGTTSSSELLSNQLSNWLSQISNEFDVGFAYRPGDELSSDQVELALSTQLFNDRVIVDGNVEYGGNQNINNAAQQNTNNLVGDVTVEYKIREDGKFRVKAFNKSNNNNFLRNNNPYTQGVGIFYKHEFESFRTLFSGNNQKKTKEEKEEEEDPEKNEEEESDEE